jgi:tetratricopeptide (TPR) repeat protein
VLALHIGFKVMIRGLWQSGGSFRKIEMKKMMVAISLCLIILCSLCLAEETDYYDWKGLKSFAAKNYTQSIIYFDMAIKQDPTYIDAWLHKGDAQRAMLDYNASLQSYEGALRVKNNTKAAWSGMVEAYISMNNYQQAAEAAAKVTEIEPNRKENWQKEGDLWQMHGDYESALAKYDRALNLDPKYVDALYRKALSKMALGNNSEAVSLLDQVLTLDLKHKAAYNVLGLIFEAEGKYASSNAAYENASRIDPLWASPRINNMHSLQALGKMDEAMKIFVTV